MAWQVKNHLQCRIHRRCRFDSWFGKIPWRRKEQPPPVFLPQKSHGQKGLVGYNPWGCEEADTTEWLSTHEHKYEGCVKWSLQSLLFSNSMNLWSLQNVNLRCVCILEQLLYHGSYYILQKMSFHRFGFCLGKRGPLKPYVPFNMTCASFPHSPAIAVWKPIA